MTEIAEPHRIEWRERLVYFLLSRLKGNDAEKEAALEMVSAAIHQAHDEGVKDCAWILHHLVEKTTGERQYAFKIAEDALNELSKRNAEDFRRHS